MKRAAIIIGCVAEVVWAYLLFDNVRLQLDLAEYGYANASLLDTVIIIVACGIAITAFALWVLREKWPKSALTVTTVSLFAASFIWLVQSASSVG